MAEVIFFIAAIGAIAGAVGTVALRNPFYCVLALVCHLLALAALFLLLRAEFVAAAQVVVYAGAVMVLYVFVVAYVGGAEEPVGGGLTVSRLRFASLLFAFALFVELTIALVGTSLSALDSDGAPYKTGFGTPAEIGEMLLTKFLIAFEVASLLLLIAAVGAVILARRRAGLTDPREISVADVMRRPNITAGEAAPETMLEAGGPPQR
jgi:NADH:ubiquinone oxidoreductase subunit 6 (subunit J)